MNPMSLILMVLVFGGMMFFMNRQQKKQQAKRQEELSSMKAGSDIITIGGLHGKIVAINDVAGTVEIDCEGVILTFERTAIKTVKTAAVEAPKVEAETKTEEVITNPIEEN